MNLSRKKVSVVARVEAALALHNLENPGVAISISALARKAGVSRANLYASHTKMLDSLPRAPVSRSDSRENSNKIRPEAEKEELVQLKKVNKALLILNLELRQEILSLKRQLHEAAQLKKRRLVL